MVSQAAVMAPPLKGAACSGHLYEPVAQQAPLPAVEGALPSACWPLIRAEALKQRGW